MSDGADRKPKPPWKFALKVWLITIVVGIVLGVVMIMLRDTPPDSSFEAGERYGNGLGTLSVIIAGIAYYVAWRKQKRGDD